MTSPESIIARVRNPVSSALIPRNRTAISSAETW